MSWPVFAIAAWLFLGLEIGLRDALELGQSGVTPSFAIILLAFVASYAPRHTAVWAGVTIGVLLDLTADYVHPTRDEVVTVLGPNALGCAAAAYTIVVMRGSMMRRNPLTLSLLSLIAMAMLAIVSTTLLEARSLWDPALRIPAAGSLWIGFLRGLYSAALALPVGALLAVAAPLFGFQQQHRIRGWHG